MTKVYCGGKNVMRKTIKACCDTRKDECPHAFEIKRKNFHFFVCCKDEGESGEIYDEK